MEFHQKKFVKFFPKNMIIDDFKYTLGLNRDDHIEYLDFENIFYTNTNENDLIGIIRIPNDTKITEDFNFKYTSPEIFIERVYPFEVFLKDNTLFPEEKKKILCPIINFRMINNPTEKVQLDYIAKNGFTICYIDNPSEKVQLAAISRNYFSINYIKNNISDDVLIKAIEKDWWFIQYIKSPSLKVQLSAIDQDVKAIDYMQSISKKDKENLLNYIRNKNSRLK